MGLSGFGDFSPFSSAASLPFFLRSCCSCLVAPVLSFLLICLSVPTWTRRLLVRGSDLVFTSALNGALLRLVPKAASLDRRRVRLLAFRQFGALALADGRFRGPGIEQGRIFLHPGRLHVRFERVAGVVDLPRGKRLAVVLDRVVRELPDLVVGDLE